MNFKAFLAALRHHWPTFVLVAAIPVLIAVGWVALAPADYVSRTQLMVSIDGSTTAAAYQNDEVATGRVNTYIGLLTSDVVSERVIATLRLPETPRQLAAKVSATNVPPKTALIDVAVTDHSPDRAKLIASTLAQEFINYTDALETPTGQDFQKVHTTVVTPATEPQERRGERAVLIALAALAGVLLGAVAVWLRTRADPLVRTADDVAAAAGVPVIGSVDEVAAAEGDHLDGYRRLRIRLRSLLNQAEESEDRGLVWVLTSADGEVETAVVASNLGRAMELGGSRAVVVESRIPDGDEGDDAKPAVGGRPKDASTGPSIQHGADGVPDTVSMNGWADDSVLTATRDAAEFIDRLRADYNTVIVAVPPVLSSMTASVLGAYADGVLLLSSSTTTRRPSLTRAAASLRATGAVLAGVVVVCGAEDDPSRWTPAKGDAVSADQ